MFRLIFVLLLSGPFLSYTLTAQLRLTIDGGFAVASFDQKPELPDFTRTYFELTENQPYGVEPLESSYVALGLAHQPIAKPWGWKTRIQFMHRGYRFEIGDDPSVPSSSGNPAHSYTGFIDLSAQLTRSIVRNLRANAGPYFSLAVHEEKFPGFSAGIPDNHPITPTDYGFNAGLSYAFGRISINVNYQGSLRRYRFASLNESYSIASGLSHGFVLNKEPRISALRIGLEYAIWE